MEDDSLPEFDNATFRHVLGHYPTGVSLITAAAPDGGKVALVVGSFTSVSLDPPLVAFFPDKRSKRWQQIAAAQKFCVNILSKEQEQLCRRLAATSDDILEEFSHRISSNGSPILDDVVAWIDCDLMDVQEAGDHYFVMGKVIALNVERPADPLMFFQGKYGSFITEVQS